MNKGFTIIEALATLTVLLILMGIGYISVLGTERRAPLIATVHTLIADMRAQQTQTMAGSEQSMGITFQSSSYTLVPQGSVTALPDNVTITPAGSSIYFAKGSGDVTGTTSITLTQTLTGETKTLTINRYGAVTDIQ